MGCLRWLLNACLGLFIGLWLLGKWTGIYALEDLPSWIEGNYVSDVEMVVGEPVSKIFPYEESQLKVIVKNGDVPVIIDKDEVDEPNSAIELSLLYTSIVQLGLISFGGLWFLSVASMVVMGILRFIL